MAVVPLVHVTPYAPGSGRIRVRTGALSRHTTTRPIAIPRALASSLWVVDRPARPRKIAGWLAAQ